MLSKSMQLIEDAIEEEWEERLEEYGDDSYDREDGVEYNVAQHLDAYG